MHTGLIAHIDRFGRNAVPILVFIGFMLVGSLPYGDGALRQAMPLFGVMCMYFWVLHAPSAMPSLVVFLLGMMQDVFWGTPLGMHALIFLILYVALAAQRKWFAQEGFGGLWLGFAVAAACAAAMQWMLLAIYHMKLHPVLPPLAQWALSCAIYPWVHRLLSCCLPVVAPAASR